MGIFPIVTVFPPAFSMRNPTQATSYKTLNFALWFLEQQHENIPWPLIKIWETSGTIPPVYLKVYPFKIHEFTISRYPELSEAALKLPGLKIFVFSLITQCSWERIHWPSIWVSYWTLSTSGLYRMTVVRGPYMASTALTWVFNFFPISLS